MKDANRSLNLVNVAGVFYILFIGLILSLFISFIELGYNAKGQKVNQIFSYFCSVVNDYLEVIFVIKAFDYLVIVVVKVDDYLVSVFGIF